MKPPFFAFLPINSCLCAHTDVPLHRLKTQDNVLKIRERKRVMVLGFMVTFVIAVCVAEAVRVNNDMNLGVK